MTGPVFCDDCQETFSYSETTTCCCGLTVCDECYEARHFCCEDYEEDDERDDDEG